MFFYSILTKSNQVKIDVDHRFMISGGLSGIIQVQCFFFKAMDHAIDVFNSSDVGIDKSRDQFIILVTDGIPNVGHEICPGYGERIKELGIKVMSF